MAKIESLGTLADISPAVAAGSGMGGVGPPAAAVDGELGAVGTPIFSGFLRELGEYNPNFTGGPFSAFLLYEQMRRGDGQVAAVLDACKLPIRSAEWSVVAPEDATPVEEEAAEFVEQNIFERCNFESTLENSLLMLDFGCAAHENVWTIDNGRVCLARMAPRLPLTFYRWITKPGTDELIGLDQLGYRAGSYVHASIPVEKMALFTFRQEGANYAGRALLRQMYQHWYTKSALYAIDAIAAERNGLGVPTITMGEKAKVEDRKAATAWVQALIAHEKTGLVLPPGWQFELKGIVGQIRNIEPSINHHNMMIAMVALAAFIVMGQSGRSSGNRSLGETMSDFFFQGLQSTADQIGQTFSTAVCAPLVKYNFPAGTRPPRLVPQDLIASKIETLGTVLAQLAGKQSLITPDADLEAWLREKLGAPEQMEDVAGDDPESQEPQPTDGADRARVVKPAPRQPKPKPVPPGKSKAKQISPGKPQDAPEKVQGSDPATGAPASVDGQPAYSVGDLFDAGKLGLRRPPIGPEVHLALSAIVNALDTGRNDVAAALRAARPRVQAEVIHKLVASPVANMHRVSVPADTKLVDEVRSILQRVSDFGTKQVGDERSRQLAGKAPGDAATIRMSDKSKDPVGLYADGVVSEFTNNLTARGANVVLDLKRNPADKTTGEFILAADDELDDQSDKWIDGVASKGVNEAFADGRQEGYEQYKDEIGSVIYSALLDINTCENCASADGQQGDTPDDIPDAPNPDCDGGDRCRCVHVYVFADEGSVAA